MKLLRIVIATFDPDPKVQKSWSLQYGDTNVSTMRINVPEDKIWTTIFVAEKEIEFPKFNDDGFVLIPDSDRRELEFSLETIANVISVFGRCKRTISSAHPCVALVTDNQKELKKLENSSGIFSNRKSIASASGVDQLDSELLEKLMDRLPALSLIAEAHSHSLAAGKFHEYVRLFEYAFALQFSQLPKKLVQFLKPVYGYTTEEIKSWTKIRDPLTHADGKKSDEIYLDSDVRSYIQRIEQAAYDVLFNKEKWHDKSRERRDIWAPIAATTNNSGNLVIKQGSEPKLGFQVFDDFGVFPQHLNGIITSPPKEWWCRMDNEKAS